LILLRAKIFSAFGMQSKVKFADAELKEAFDELEALRRHL
jgi:hypothetical protein